MRMFGSRPISPTLGALAGLLALTAGELAARGKTPLSLSLSPVIYPKKKNQLVFSHQNPRHRQLPCDRCHRSIRRSISSQERNQPKEAICRPCHAKITRAEMTVKQGPKEACSRCHRGYTGVGIPARPVRPQANLRFSHRLHLDKGASCEACHRRQSAISMPSMSRCRGCHERRGASNRCVVCHLSNKDGRVRTRYDSGKLRPRGTLVGDAHDQRFARSHKSVARSNRRYCESCHQPRTCLKCHSGTLRPVRIHPGDYATRHSLDARRNQPRCQSCHRSQTFCLGCHQRSGVGMESADSGFRPTTGRRFHAPRFAATKRGPGHHAYSAKRNIRTCSGCHRESTCVRCHGTRQRGMGGFSPHPKNFRFSTRCSMLSARNQRVCLKCHAVGDRRIGCQ
jgi:hypothetical protein